jgi:prepilin-type N-terminal cleavage/methylation domain-containing protein
MVMLCAVRPARSSRRSLGAFTLIEILIVVALLGIAGAMVIPAMGSTGALRIQAAVRTIVADITVAQSEAVAFQERRALVFDVENSSYRVISVPGNTLDPENNTLYDPSRRGGQYIVSFADEDRYGDARITAAAFDGQPALIFDAMGGPISDPGANTPSAGGSITITGSGQTFIITVEAFTGRVTVTRQAGQPAPPAPGG